MFKHVIIQIFIYALLAGMALASPPSIEAPNIVMEFNLDQKPERIGDCFKVSCLVTFKMLDDSITQKYLWGKSDNYYAKCYFDTHPRKVAVSDDSATWIQIDLGNQYSYSANFKVMDTGKFSIWPIVEIRDNRHSGNNNSFIARNTVKGGYIHIMGDTTDDSIESKQTDIIDTGITIFKAIIPPKLNKVDLNGEKSVKPKIDSEITPPPRHIQYKY